MLWDIAKLRLGRQSVRQRREARRAALTADEGGAPSVRTLRNPPIRRADGQPTARQESFDVGDEPLRGASWPPPRRCGWERPWQR